MAGGKCGLPLKICTRVVEDIRKFVFDLMSGSGDKGTPVILIQGYFDDLSHD